MIMLPERVNLQKELEKFRNKTSSEKIILEEVFEILNSEQEKEAAILKRLHGQNPGDPGMNELNPDLLKGNRIFHVSHIKKICVDYRLRFLPTTYFKGDLPAEALLSVKELEKQHQATIHNFHMIAPAEFFRLENADDPMLFASLGNGYFYLIHKWGKDMHPLRKLKMWPLRSLENLLIFSLILSLVLTYPIREIFFSRFQETSQFLFLFLYTFKSVVVLIFFYGISLGKNVSSGNWNSKFYNA